MRKLILLLIFSGCLVGCHMYRPDVQQGNVVTPKQANQLRLGMSQTTVKMFLGDPLLINTFTNNRLNYVYTYKHKNLPMTERQVILTFRKNRLVNIRKKFA
jgi:outer membrane protein assembly factor BamE